MAVRTALQAVERTRVEERAAQGHARAAALLRLLDNPPRSLAPINFLNLGALLVLAITTTWRAVGDTAAPVLPVYSLLTVLAIWLAGYVAASVAAASRAEFVAELAAPLVAGLVVLAQPFLMLEAWWTHRARGAPRATERVTSDDIQIIVTEGNQERKLEEIEPEEREMIAGIIEMSERTARDLMIPRLDVIALDADASLDQALDVATKYGHSRLPLYEGDIDHIIGVLHVKDLIEAVRHSERRVTLRSLFRAVHYVPDTAKADDLLRDLLRRRVHMAVVVDEYGGTVGVVTIEDALEEIVGEIRDEYDAAEEPEFVRVNDDVAVFNGRVPIAEVNDVLGLQLPTGESDTLGGLVYTLLGRMPKQGDRVTAGSVELQVAAVAGRRIKQVRVSRLEPQTDKENKEEP